ncbi:MAG: trigger factor [Acholeplasmataceae bacterium]|nr:trigger factor [Acholeplasmataceae bacterium]
MKVEKIGSNRAKFTFEVSAHEFEHGLDHAFDHVQKDVELKGFRKGKVPRNMYETKFGVESLYEEALNHVFHHKYKDAQNHPDYQIVGEPSVDLDIAAIKRGEAFDFSFEVAVKPDVVLGTYKGIKAKKIDVNITESEVNAEIRNLLSKDGSLEPKTGALELGDVAIFDFEGFLNNEPFEGGKAENHQLEIGSNTFIPGFEEQMIGMQIGDEKDLSITFPKNYQAKNLAGQPVIFKIKLHEVKSKVLKELNDAWVKTLEREGINTVEALKAETKKNLESSREIEIKNDLTNQVVGQILKSATVDIPKEMIETEIKHHKDNVVQQAKQYGIEYEMFLSMNGVTVEQFEEQIAVEAENMVRTTLVFEAIAKAEKIEPSEDEVKDKYEEIAKKYNMPADDVKKYLPVDMIKGDLSTQKAYQLVVEWADLT